VYIKWGEEGKRPASALLSIYVVGDGRSEKSPHLLAKKCEKEKKE
jgi:hypothetical protein